MNQHIFFKNPSYYKENGLINQARISEKFIRINYPDLYDDILIFHNLYNISIKPFSKLLWHYKNKLKSIPICSKCNEKDLSWISFSKGYSKHCSVKCSANSIETVNKRKITSLKKYGNSNYNNRSKSKKTCINKYGVGNISQANGIRDKVKQTNLEKYGHESFTSTDIFKEKSKDTCLEKYGVDFSMQSKDIQEKSKSTSLKNYGVEHPLQNKTLFNKAQKSAFTRFKYKDTELYYQGTYELDFLEHYYDSIEIQNGLSINYLFESNNHVYHSDFYLPKYNLIVEIKSDYIYNLHLKTNIRKQKACVDQGYNFIFIIDKNYVDLDLKL